MPQNGADRRLLARPRARGAAVLLAGALIGLLVGAVASSQVTTRYESSMRMLVGPLGGDRTTLDAAGLLSQTYADLVSSRTMVGDVAASLGVAVDLDDVSAQANPQSRVILLTVVDDDARIAPAVADALADELIAVVNASTGDPEESGAVSAGPTQVRVLDEANDSDAVRPPSALFVVGGAVLGLLAAASLLRYTPLFRTDGATDRLESLDIPIVRVEADRADGSASADEWDLVAAQIRHALGDPEASSVSFMPMEEDAALASVFLQIVAAEARSGRGVVAVDADSERPELLDEPEDHAFQIVSPVPGGTVVTQPVEPFHSSDDRSVATEQTVHVAYFRDAPGRELGAMARLRAVVGVTARDGNLVAALTPSPGTSPVAASAAAVVDRVVLLMRSERTAVADVDRALDMLESVGTSPAAVVDLGWDVDAGEVFLRPAGGDMAEQKSQLADDARDADEARDVDRGEAADEARDPDGIHGHDEHSAQEQTPTVEQLDWHRPEWQDALRRNDSAHAPDVGADDYTG